MNDLTIYLGKTVRFSYVKNGEPYAITGHLKTIQEDRVSIGGIWHPLIYGYKIKEVEYKGA